MKRKDTYSEPKTLYYPGAVVKVYSPILTEDEVKKRREIISKSALRLLNSKSK